MDRAASVAAAQLELSSRSEGRVGRFPVVATLVSTLVDCIGYIEEVFDIAYSKGDWRGYLSEHKALFDAHSQSVYSE